MLWANCTKKKDEQGEKKHEKARDKKFDRATVCSFKGALKFANKQTKPKPKPNQMNKNKTKHILRDLKTTHKTHKKFPAIINLSKQTPTMMRYHCTP